MGLKRGFILEGPIWNHFGYGEGQERDCESCAAEFRRTGKAPAAATDCWKVEIWLGDAAIDATGRARLLDTLMDAARRDMRLMGKVSAHPMPKGDSGGFDRVVLMYFMNREEAERFADWIAARAPAGGWRPTVRRGCWHYEPVAGPWQTWDA